MSRCAWNTKGNKLKNRDMNRTKYIFILWAGLLLAASCTKDTLPAGDGTDSPAAETQTYTFTVSPDLAMEGDAPIRSAGTPEEMPARCFMQIFGNNVNLDVQPSESIENGSFTFSVRCFMQIFGNNVSQDVQQSESIENGSFTFSVKLPNTTYTFLFWADNGSGDTPTDLREVQYTPGTVAFAAKVVDTPENMIENKVSLKHAVTKVTLKTTAKTSASEGESIKVTTTCATIYNVDNLSASSSSAHTATKTFDTSTDFAVNDNIATFYFLPQNETQSVDVEFHLLKQTIESVPLAANTHVTLQGNLSEDNPKWGATKEYAEKQIDRFFEDENGNPKGDNMGDGSYGFYLPLDRISELEAVIGAIFHEKVEIQLDGLTVFEKNLEEDYIFLINYNQFSQYLAIYINYNLSYKIILNNSGFKDFSAVSDVLEQSTE